MTRTGGRGNAIGSILGGRPTTSFALASLAVLLTAILGLALLAQVPRADFAFSPTDDGLHLLVDGKTLDADDQVAFTGADGADRLIMPARQLADYWEPRESREDRDRFFANRDRLAEMLARPGTTMRLPDGSTRIAGARQGFHIPPWTLLVAVLSGLASALISLWLFSIRPAEATARAFLACGLLFYLNTLLLAGLMSLNPAVPGQWASGILQFNYLACLLIAMSLIDLFGRYPLPLVPGRALSMLWIAAPGLGLAPWLAAVDRLYVWYDAFIGVLALAIITLVVAQIRASRARPDIMAAFRWIGSTLFFSIVCVFFFAFLPQFAGRASLDTSPILLPIFTLFFLSLGVAVTRYRLFDLGGWATQIARTAAILMAVLVLDFVVAIVAGTTWTLSFALFLAALIWIPAREYALRRTERARGVENIVLLRHANRVAFSRGRDEQDEAWRAFLQAQFDPLTATPAPCEAIALEEEGQTLRVPSPLGPGGMGMTLRL